MLRCHYVASRFKIFRYDVLNRQLVFFFQQSLYILLMISLFLSPSSLSFAPTLLHTCKNILYLNTTSVQCSCLCKLLGSGSGS